MSRIREANRAFTPLRPDGGEFANPDGDCTPALVDTSETGSSFHGLEQEPDGRGMTPTPRPLDAR